MWLSAIKLAAQAGTHIFKKRQETKMLMADAQMMHARKMAQGEEAYQGKLLRIKKFGLEGRGGFDNFKFAHSNFGLGSRIGRSNSDGQSKIVL